MTYVVPIPLPAVLFEQRGVVAKHDFAHTHHTVAFGPDGRGYVHSELFYNMNRYGGDGEVAAQIVTRLDRDFSITGQVLLEELHHAMTHAGDDYVYNNEIAPLAVTARGEVVFATTQNRTFVYDAELANRIATFDPLTGGPPGFSDLVGLPDGIVARRDGDAIGIATLSPELRTITSMRELETRVEWAEFRGYVGRMAALDLDRILVTLFVHRGRSGWIDNAAFRFLVIAGDGRIVATLPLGGADTPYGKTGAHTASFVAHRGLAAWLTRSDAALHVFDRDGARLQRIGLAETERFAAVVPLALTSVGPRGELVFVHRKHHVIVVSDPVTAANELEPALADIGAVYAAEYSRLKKAVPYASGRWLGFEPTTPRALAKPTKARAKPRAQPVAVAPPAIAKTPAEAMTLAPHDLDTLGVYADSLAATDAALGEYIHLGIRLERLPANDPQREELEACAASLLRVHRIEWFSRWNAVVQIFDTHYQSFCGLPSGVRLDGAPTDLAAIDRQVRELPIHSLVVRNMSTRELAKLSTLAVMRRITELTISGGSKHKLGKPVLAWLAEQRLTNVVKLALIGVTVTGAGLREVVDTMPQLRELTVMSAQLSADGLDALAASTTAAHLTKLALLYNPLGSSALAGLARFPAVRDLELGNTDIGDDVASSPPPRLGVTKLDISDCPRLGRTGLAWLVAAMPELRELRLPSALPPDAVVALEPIAGQLEAIDASWLSLPTKTRLVETIVPRATSLRTLVLTGDGGGLAERLAGCDSLVELELGDVNDADLAALASARSLAKLELGEGTSDANLAALACSPHLLGLHTLSIRSRQVTEAGIARCLDAPWRLARLELMYVQIRGTLPVIRSRPFVLRLFKCDVPRGQLDQLRRDWGDRLHA